MLIIWELAVYSHNSNNHSSIKSISEHKSSRAFSLIELSIVLVIMGLLVGGVVAGKSLMDNKQGGIISQ